MDKLCAVIIKYSAQNEYGEMIYVPLYVILVFCISLRIEQLRSSTTDIVHGQSKITCWAVRMKFILQHVPLMATYAKFNSRESAGFLEVASIP